MKGFFKVGEAYKRCKMATTWQGEMRLLIPCIICQTSSTFSPKCKVGCTTIEHPNKGEFTLSWGIV